MVWAESVVGGEVGRFRLTFDSEALLQRKRKYRTLDAMISDENLLDNVRKFETGTEEGALTLGRALLRDHHPPPFPSGKPIRSLEENLAIFAPSLTAEGQADLARNLLNGSVQFLNTLAELGLARRYRDQGWTVRLAQLLPGGQKDVDMLLGCSAEERWLDVLNAAAHETAVDGFAPLLPPDLEFRLLDKVVDKFRKKFQQAIQQGWSADAWVALDITKHDDLNVAMHLLALTGSNKLDLLAAEVLALCPDLCGVVYFLFDASNISPHWVKEFPRKPLEAPIVEL